MRLFISIFILLAHFSGQSQLTVFGTITTSKEQPIIGANVYLEGTYDGATSNENGTFSFSTSETGVKTFIVSYMGYETFYLSAEVKQMHDLKISLKEDVNTLDAVVLSAGTFEAGDNSKVNVLKPLDVVTTASALGDFVGALQTLPGTNTVAEDGRLFVRGGEAEETQIFIDGIRVFTPYSPSTNNTPTRGRYSPFLFDGITFSTGGYSAEYGQALSSVLLLNSIETPDQEKTDLGIMSVGLTLGNTQKWDNSSLSLNGAYINLSPYNEIFSDRNDWHKPYRGFSSEAVYRHRFENGILKLYTAFEKSKMDLTQDDINNDEGVRFGLKNQNLYFNGSYKGMLNETWSIKAGMSYTVAEDKIKIMDNRVLDNENSAHFKIKLKKRFSNRVKLRFGAEYFTTDFTERFSSDEVSPIDYSYNNNLAATFAEADIFFSKDLAMKTGVRGEYSELFKEYTISPRLSLAYKVSDKSQISLAYGDFYQTPTRDILKFEHDLESQKTNHYIANYQLNTDRQIFRAELYYKDYSNLVKYDEEFPTFDSIFNNDGYGHAKGLDLFWRDGKTFKNTDYWISYSFLDSEREYRHFPTKAQPHFANKHNLSVVGKYFIEDWKSQVGFSYNYASGRTYTNPNMEGFLNAKTKSYNSLSLNWAYLVSQQKILYFSIQNAMGIRNVNGYQYTNTPDMNGVFNRRALRPAVDQFFFVGFFWTISDDNTSNQLDNL